MKKKWLCLCMAGLCISLLGCGEQKKAEEPPPVTVSAEEEKAIFLQKKMETMTTEEKVGQLFFCAFRQDAQGNPITAINEEMTQTIGQYHIGGVVLFGENIDTTEQTKQLITDIQKTAEIPLFIGVDEEGGRVSRLHASGKIKVADIPPAADIGATGDTEQAYAAGKSIGQELRELGFTVDFAPVADINTNPENKVIGDRAFSAEPEEAGAMAAAFTKGLQSEGIASCVKHFPGHGDTVADSHNGMAMVSHDLQRLRQVEWIPFQRVMGQGVEFVMVGHINTPNATTESVPATLSAEMMTTYLREELGYTGIIITDAMDMGAIVQYYGGAEAAVKALQAGADMVLMPADLPKAYQGVLEAVKDGSISEEALEEKVARILSLKYKK